MNLDLSQGGPLFLFPLDQLQRAAPDPGSGKLSVLKTAGRISTPAVHSLIEVIKRPSNQGEDTQEQDVTIPPIQQNALFLGVKVFSQ